MFAPPQDLQAQLKASQATEAVLQQQARQVQLELESARGGVQAAQAAAAAEVAALQVRALRRDWYEGVHVCQKMLSKSLADQPA